MKFLYLEKKQRVNSESLLSRRAARIKEELDKIGAHTQISHFDDLTIELNENKSTIRVGGSNITNFTHILFGGHASPKEYEIKFHIANLLSDQIKIQNSSLIRRLPYYNKLSMSLIMQPIGIPSLHTFLQVDGEYTESTLPLKFPLVLKDIDGINDLVQIGNERKIKKNIFKADSIDDFKQGRLATHSLKNYLVQEFSDAGEDYRVFISRGEIIGGFKRKAVDSFITVSRGEYSYYNTPSPEIRDYCDKISRELKPDFMALDFIYKDGRLYLLEFSLNPGFFAYETKCSGEGKPTNIAEAIIKSFE